MKTLNIKKLSIGTISAQAIPAVLDQEGIVFQPLSTVNWPEAFPYQPQTAFRMAQTPDSLLLHYLVDEASVRAVAGADNGPVWEDACVEFFSIPSDDGIYYNMECNCVGNLLIEAGPGRKDRLRAPQVILDQVDRWASLGSIGFEEQFAASPHESIHWEVALRIPYSAYFLHRIESLSEQTIQANFYKCGDKLTTPHYLSWNAIDLPEPNFHCPEFFGQLKMQ